MADDNSGVLPLVSVLSEFESVFGHPESYLKPPAILQKNTLSAIKQIFDFCKKDELSGTRSLVSTCPLQELLVENFDDEQIWQEIELQNTPLLRVLKQDIHSLKENVDQLSLLSGSSKVVKGNRLQRSDSNDGTVSGNANGFVKSASESDTESDSVNEGYRPDDSDDQMDDGGGDNDDEENENDCYNNDSSKVKSSTNNNREQKSKKKKSQVDDTFFKLSDMLQFLDKEDRRYERAHRNKSQKESDDNDDDDDDNDEIDSEPVDYFIDMDSDDIEEEEDEEWSRALGITETLLGRCISVLVHLFK